MRKLAGLLGVGSLTGGLCVVGLAGVVRSGVRFCSVGLLISLGIALFGRFLGGLLGRLLALRLFGSAAAVRRGLGGVGLAGG